MDVISCFPETKRTREQVRNLVQRLRDREPQAMAELYDEYGGRVFGFLYRFTNNRAQAEDLVQETFLRVWTRTHTFDQDRSALGPWIFTIARNCALDAHRSRAGRMARREMPLAEREGPSEFARFDRSLVEADQARSLKAAFKKLTPNQRTVIELAYYDGLSQSEMAKRMKQPLGTVKTWARRALVALRHETALS